MSHSNFVAKPWIGVSALVLSTVLYGGFGILTRLMGFNLDLLFAGWTRNLTAAAILLIPLWLTKKFAPVLKADLMWMLARSAAGLFGFIGSFYGMFYLDLGTAYFMYFGGSTIGSFVLGSWLFKEKLTWPKLASLGLAFAGLLMVYKVTINPQDLPYIWLILASGFGGALWGVLSKKISGKYSDTQVNGLDFLMFGLIALVISVVRRETWVWPSLTTPWLANLLFMLTFIITGQLIVVGFKHLDAQRGSLIQLLEIAFGIILGWLIFHEQLSLWAMLGGGLIVVAAALPNVWELVAARRKNPKSAAQILKSQKGCFDMLEEHQQKRRLLKQRSNKLAKIYD